MLGKRIKYLRIKMGLSINELSEQSGISKSYLSYIEREIQKNPSLHVLSKLAKTLETSVDNLLQTTTKEDIVIAPMDHEWIQLVTEAIDQGITKEEFEAYLTSIKLKKKRSKTN